MNIISWNVNGIRAVHNRGDFDWLIKKSPDIFCLQETKAHPDQLVNELRSVPGYISSYFAHSETKKGYSGVAIYSKKAPISSQIGLGIKEFDQEGRLIQVEFPEFYLLNVYFPNGGGGPIRLDYKFRFYDAFLKYVNALKKNKPVIFCGDVNTAHEAVDLARPKENEDNTGFLPEERAWIDEVILSGFVDVFRFFYPDKKDVYTYWDMKTSARIRNVGWRIDYFFVTHNFLKSIKKFITHTEVRGSDHCPIEIVIGH